MTHKGLETVKEVFSRHFLLADPYVLKLLRAIFITHHMPSDPFWMFIAAPSGAGKTELINSLVQAQDVWPISSLTSKTLASGAQSSNGETSLLVRMQNGIIVIEDFTVLMSEHPEELANIMGQFRSIYSGKFDKAFGTGQGVNWEGKITLLAGATYSIHSLRERHGQLGERFLIYSPIQPDEDQAAIMAMDNQASGKIKEGRQAMKDVMGYDLNEWVLPNIPQSPEDFPPIEEDVRIEMLELAKLAATARTHVMRDRTGRDIIEIPSPEKPTRFATQLQILAQALTISNRIDGTSDKLLPEDKELLFKITLDSITFSKRKTLQALSKHDVVDTRGLALTMSISTAATSNWLEDLQAVGMVEKVGGKNSQMNKWKLKSRYADLIRRYDHIQEEGGVLGEDGSIEDPAPEVEKTTADPEFSNLLTGL